LTLAAATASVSGMTEPATATSIFLAARDFLLANRADYATAYDGFQWPRLPEFNWAIDWFDAGLAAEYPDAPALWIVEEDGSEQRLSFAELSQRSQQVAGWLRGWASSGATGSC